MRSTVRVTRGLRRRVSRPRRFALRFAASALPLGGDGRFEIADAVVRTLQLNRLVRLRVPKRVLVGVGEARGEHDSIRIESLDEESFEFLR